MGRLGLIAGDGLLPVELARAANDSGHEVVTAMMGPTVDRALEGLSVVSETIQPGLLDTIIAFFRDHGASDVVMAGKVNKAGLFGGAPLDGRFMSVIRRLSAMGDDELLRGIAAEFGACGLNVRDQRELLRSRMPQEGILTKRRPTPDEIRDIRYGFHLAKQIGVFDIGQTIVVGKGTVLAVEAVEGTDECIIRGGTLGNGHATAIKVAKPNQDMRFDVPTIGLATIVSMAKARVTALALEAGNTFLIEADKAIAHADEAGISIVVLKDSGFFGVDDE